MMFKTKAVFLAVWALLLTLVPWTVFENTTLEEVLSSPALIVNTVQRLVGLWAYTLLFVQLVLGAFMARLTEKYGAWVYNFHIIQGIFIYLLVVLHPLAFVISKYLFGGGFDPFYTFTQICLLCNSYTEFYLTLGRISFWLLSITVFMGLFRTINPFVRRHWKKFHTLNYLVFGFVWFHSLGVGSDVGSKPFSLFHGPAFGTVVLIGLYKIYTMFSKKSSTTSNSKLTAKLKRLHHQILKLRESPADVD